MRTVIKPGALIDGTGGPPLRAPAVVLEDGRIAWVGRAADLADDVAEAQTIVAPESTLLPGFIDCHVHLVCSGKDATPTPRQFLQATDEELLLTAVASAQAGLQAGVTTMRDVGGRGFLVIQLRDAITAGYLRGPRILAAGPALTTTGGHFFYFGWEADTAEQAASAVRALCKGGVDFIKVMGTGGMSTPRTNPLRAQYTLEHMRAIVEDAHRLGRRVTVHVHGVPGIRNSVGAGVDSLEHCTWLGESGDCEYDETIVEQMLKKDIYVSLGMPATRYLHAPLATVSQITPEQRRDYALRESRFEMMRKMLAAGVKIAASSDAGMLFQRTADFVDVLEMMVTHFRTSELEAIKAATATAAAVLGMADEIGAITKGKRADLILISGDPLQDIRSLRRVHRVFRDGRTVAMDGMLAVPA